MITVTAGATVRAGLRNNMTLAPGAWSYLEVRVEGDFDFQPQGRLVFNLSVPESAPGALTPQPLMLTRYCKTSACDSAGDEAGLPDLDLSGRVDLTSITTQARRLQGQPGPLSQVLVLQKTAHRDTVKGVYKVGIHNRVFASGMLSNVALTYTLTPTSFMSAIQPSPTTCFNTQCR